MASKDLPTISLVIPAWNEADYLPRLLDSVEIAKDRYRGGAERIQVIVADNGSTDATAEISRERGCVVAPVAKRCIAAARNGGAAVATGELLCFSDADFRLDPETFNYIGEVMRRPGVVGGGTGILMERWSLGIRASWYLVLPALWSLGLDGGVWFCRRADFVELGGYNETLKAAEDVCFLFALKRLGRRRKPREQLLTRFGARRFGLRPPYVINSTRKFDKYGDWHMLWDMARLFPLAIFGRRYVDQHIQRYFYEGRGPASQNG